MSNPPPSNRLSVPASAPSWGPLPTQLRSAMNEALLGSSAIPAIHAALLHECQATGFITALKARARELLRSGECGSYTEVMAVIMTELRERDAKDGTKGDKDEMSNGLGHGDGEGVKVKIPQRVIEEGVRVVRNALEDVVEIGED